MTRVSNKMMATDDPESFEVTADKHKGNNTAEISQPGPYSTFLYVTEPTMRNRVMDVNLPLLGDLSCCNDR